MKTLIIGGSGFIGRNLINKLLKSNYSVINCDFFNNITKLNNYNFIDLNNFLNNSLLINHLASQEFNYIIFLASKLRPNSDIKEYLGEINSIGSLYVQILDFYKTFKNIKFIYISSGGCIYGKSSYPPNESTNPMPNSLYGLKHLYFENLLFFYSKYGLKYLIFRPSNPFGVFQNPKSGIGLITKLLYDAHNNLNTDIWAHPKSIRDYIPIEIMCDHIITLMPKISNDIFNLGSGVQLSVQELIELINHSLNITLKVNYINPKKAIPDTNILNISKLKNLNKDHNINLNKHILQYWQSIKK